MRIAVIPHPQTNDMHLEQKQRDKLLELIQRLKDSVHLHDSYPVKVGCGQRRLTREISYLVAEEFGTGLTSVYPWLNPENLSRVNRSHIEAVCEAVESQDLSMMVLVAPKGTLPLFVHYFKEQFSIKNETAIPDSADIVLLIDTEAKTRVRFIV